MSGLPSAYLDNVHAIGATGAWTVLLNISIVSAALRYDKVAAMAHAIFGWMILLLTFIAILVLLGPYGFYITPQAFGTVTYVHGILGCMLIGFVILQVAGGTLATILQRNKMIDIIKVKPIRAVHRYFGYFLALLYKLDILYEFYVNTYVFISLMIWEVLWITAFICIKLFLHDIQTKIIDPQTINYVCPRV